MKSILISVLAFCSFSLFANVDDFVGTYNSVSKYNDQMVIEKVLVAQPTLFEEAKYEYRASFKVDRNRGIDGLSFREVVLELSEDGDSLSTQFEQDCDDPGCYYYEVVQIDVWKSNGKPKLEVYYYGWWDNEESGEAEELEDRITFSK